MTTLHQQYTALLKQLAACDTSAEHEAKLILSDVCGIKRPSDIFLHDERLLSSDECQQIAAIMQQRLTGQPLPYILGWVDFHDHRLHITPDVLIPRPDTETLVQCALDISQPITTVLDMGTGSGAIAVALAHERPNWTMTATDVSTKALTVAKQNGHGLNIEFVESDWFENIHDRFDLIVSNPPYIEANDPHLQTDIRFEPQLALVSGDDGLQAIRTIVSGAKQHLNPGGYLILEHGYDQGNAVHDLLSVAGFGDVKTIPDLAGRDRVTMGRLAS